MHSAPTSKQLRAPSPIELDDLRLLGDALVSGKQVSDAMLVLQKLRGMVHTPEFLPSHRIESIEGFRDLNETEKKILGYLIGGFDAKETARMLKVTPSHVYNMRSAIRIKLNIPREEKISHWLMEHYPHVFNQV
jgi:DNA-binding CsgD family transcriptional regulator